MNYIGSKHSLLGEVGRVLDEGGVPAEGLAIDLFAGTGTVARFLKARGHIVYANDWQHYSYVTNLALIERSDMPRFERLLSGRGCGPSVIRVHDEGPEPTLPLEGGVAPGSGDSHPSSAVLRYLEQLHGEAGLFTDTYCEAGACGRLYYSAHNGRHIQAIRDTIARWSAGGLLESTEEAWLVACLIEAADKVANTAAVYGAFEELFGCVRARHILFSYNNEGLLTPDQLRSLFARHCTAVSFHEVDYRRFRADVDRENRVYKGDATREFLILGTLAAR